MDRLDQLVDRVRDGDTGALARAISLTESSSELANALNNRVCEHVGRASLVGITGVPGAGKSTLVNGMIKAWRHRNQRVAVVAVDPSSPISGGAVLGDRVRMHGHGEDSGVFIRSVASRGHLGGLSADTLSIVDLIDAAGWDVILLETVGTGQSETEVADIADVNIVVNAPSLGDDVQAIKAGILETADVLVVNKADLPLASRTEKQLIAMLQLRDATRQQVPIVKTVATENVGTDRLLDVIEKVTATQKKADGKSRHAMRARRMLANDLAHRVKALVLAGADVTEVQTSISRVEQAPHN